MWEHFGCMESVFNGLLLSTMSKQCIKAMPCMDIPTWYMNFFNAGHILLRKRIGRRNLFHFSFSPHVLKFSYNFVDK
jgi:hypothetical protein